MQKPISKFRKSQLELNAKYIAQPSPEQPANKSLGRLPLAIRNSIEVVRYISR